MADRKELVSKLGELKKEFEGFPEEQLLTDVIDELSTSDSRVTIPSPGEPVRVTDILLMARTLSAYCQSRQCGECVFNDLSCSWGSTLLRDIDAEMLAKHEGEVVTFYDEEEK